MILKFIPLKAGGASGRELVDYLTEKDRDVDPEVVRGDPDRTAHLIDALDFEQRYTHGVISFTSEEGDGVDVDMQERIIDSFEEHAFPGLEPDQYDILWVRHEDKERLELHFATPRVELTSGKSLNIAPPGHEGYYEPWRELTTQRYHLVDSKDPEVARDLVLPQHVYLERSAARAAGDETTTDPREIIHEEAMKEIGAGRITNQEDMAKWLEGQDLEVVRMGRDSVTVRDVDSNEVMRLKGRV